MMLQERTHRDSIGFGDHDFLDARCGELLNGMQRIGRAFPWLRERERRIRLVVHAMKNDRRVAFGSSLRQTKKATQTHGTQLFHLPEWV